MLKYVYTLVGARGEIKISSDNTNRRRNCGNSEKSVLSTLRVINIHAEKIQENCFFFHIFSYAFSLRLQGDFFCNMNFLQFSIFNHAWRFIIPGQNATRFGSELRIESRISCGGDFTQCIRHGIKA